VSHKKGATENLANYRGLTLLNSVSKAAEYFLKARLSPFCEAIPALSDAQGGFRPDRRCADQQFVLREILSSRLEAKLPTFVAFIDIFKAYDTVWPEGLRAALAKANISGRFQAILNIMASVISRRARIGETSSTEFAILRGVPQGAVLSPLLYAIFFDGLLQELEASGLGVCIAGLNIPDLAFADDLVLFASSPEEMNKLLAIVHRHSIQWRYSVNAAKCAIAVIGTKAQEQEGARQHFTLGSERLATDQDYEYLGVLLSALRGKPSTFVESRLNAAKAKAPILSGAGGARFNGIQPLLSVRL